MKLKLVKIKYTKQMKIHFSDELNFIGTMKRTELFYNFDLKKITSKNLQYLSIKHLMSGKLQTLDVFEYIV